MTILNSSNKLVGNSPNQIPFNLINILEPVLWPQNQVTVFMDDETDPLFADLYSMEVGTVIKRIGCSEGYKLDIHDFRYICDQIFSHVTREQGV